MEDQDNVVRPLLTFLTVQNFEAMTKDFVKFSDLLSETAKTLTVTGLQKEVFILSASPHVAHVKIALNFWESVNQ